MIVPASPVSRVAFVSVSEAKAAMKSSAFIVSYPINSLVILLSNPSKSPASPFSLAEKLLFSLAFCFCASIASANPSSSTFSPSSSASSTVSSSGKPKVS